MIRRALLAAMVLLPGTIAAQATPRPKAPRADTTAARDSAARGRRDSTVVRVDSTGRTGLPGDTSRSDSTKRELVHWAEPDSVMSSLLARSGYVTTRYQGRNAVFDATGKRLILSGNAAVNREQMLLVADTIIYSDTLKRVAAASPPGDTIVLHDPSYNGQGDLIALGRLVYDLRQHKGVASQISTASAEGGQTWYLAGEKSAVQGDTTGKGQSTAYTLEGAITSCDLPTPHYHFEAKEVKLVNRTILVARPAVLYIADIPVMWLPFIFQDMRRGRRSGIIPPRFGLSDIVRTSPSYDREIDNLGYYFAISDYMDALVSFDWRSGNSDRVGDIGWTKWNGEWQYNWLSRFLRGSVRTTYGSYSDGSTQWALSWQHSQQFSQRSSLTANINYSSNTSILNREALTVAQTLAAIASAFNYQNQLGPMSVSLGGTRTQYSGRSEVNQNFPNLNITSKPIDIASWLTWSPTFSLTNNESFHLENQSPFLYSIGTGGAVDSARGQANQRSTQMTFGTPLRIGSFNWQNTFTYSDNLRDFPQNVVLQDFHTAQPIGTRVYAKTYVTSLDWQTAFSLPALSQGKWNITPSISVVNANQGAAFFVRTQFTGSDWVHQSKKLQYSISSSPTFFGFFPGFGPFARLRHSIQPTISYSYAPASNVSDEFLRALGTTRAGYLGDLQQSSVTVGLNQVIEAKLRAKSDTNPDAGEKIKLLALNTTPLTYDFEVARKTHRVGITTSSWSYNARSDLLPGFDLSVHYSLFQGDPMSDTARFKPFRTGIDVSFTIGRNNNPFARLSQIFGGAAPPDSSAAGVSDVAAGGNPLFETHPVAGPASSRYPYAVNAGAGWSLSINFNSTRSRPITGTNVTVFDPRAFCQQYQADPILYTRCLQQPPPADTLITTTAGAPIIVTPPRSTLRASTSFRLTKNWAMQWSTGYDFQQHEFSDHIVSLQRDLHDWRATFAFTQAPNGNFAFNFFISLIALPDLKFNYDRRTYRPVTGGSASP